ncbi:hypothetical protein C0993_007258 [Termitomyces sp. T159_Od127]|nr:hypothetical protein C0993_007258 [Termitomyces sp. T159_Od127]
MAPALISTKRAEKRKIQGRPSTTRKKIKTQHRTLEELPWKKVARPQEAGVDGDDGILELEEIEGVDVIYEETSGGRLVKFAVCLVYIASLAAGASSSRCSKVKKAQRSLLHQYRKPNPGRGILNLLRTAELLPDWHELSLHPRLLKSLYLKGFVSPTPIQAASLPVALHCRDVVGIAQTGSGKTLAYGLPILHHLLSQPRPKLNTKRRLRALILCPTRELALQVSSHLNASLNFVEQEQSLSEGSGVQDKELTKKVKGKVKIREELSTPATKKSPPHVSVAAIVGGMSAQKQRRILDRGVDVLVATPGRLWDIMQDDDVLSREIKTLRFLVLDEADRMIEAGHFAELENILRLTLRENKFTKHFRYLPKLLPDVSCRDDQIKNPVDGQSGGENDQDGPQELVKDGLQTFIFSATLSKDLQKNVKRQSRPKSAGKYKKRDERPASTLDDLILRLDFRDPDPQVIDLSPAGGVVSTLQESKIECLSGDKVSGIKSLELNIIGFAFQDVYLYYFLLRHPGKSLVFLSSIDGIRRLMPLTDLLNIKAFPLHSQLEQQEDEIQEIPVELSMLDKLKYRVQLARKIETSHHKIKKANHDRNWMKEAAAAMEIELDSDYLSEDDEEKPSNKKRKAKDAKNAALKAELKYLLSQPLIARGISTKYITSGSRPIVDDLIVGANHEKMLGLKKEDAGSSLIARKKKKKRLVKQEEGWDGIDTKD